MILILLAIPSQIHGKSTELGWWVKEYGGVIRIWIEESD